MPSLPDDSYKVGGSKIDSSGYADDTITISDTWGGIVRKHDWLRDFFVAHHWDISPPKAHLVISEGGMGKPRERSLPPIRWDLTIESDISISALDGEVKIPEGVDHSLYWQGGSLFGIPTIPKPSSPVKDIVSHGPSYEFRYLGIMISIDMSWKAMRLSLARQVRATESIIRCHRLNNVQAAAVINEFAIPRMEIGLRYVPLSATVTSGWDKAWRWAMQVAPDMLGCSRVSSHARALFTSVSFGQRPLPII
jgi:hypothetical protein